MEFLLSSFSIFLQALKKIFLVFLFKKIPVYLKFYKYVNNAQNYVLLKNASFIIVNKKYDFMINSNDSTKLTLQTFLRDTYPYLVNPTLKHEFFFVHRLDYATSGVVCIALNKEACREAMHAFQKRNTKKYYIALLRGHVSKEFINFDQSIGEDFTETSNHKMCTSNFSTCISPRAALTKLLVLELGYFEEYPATKVLLRPITGRRHQLRVHCSYLGHTIVGDYTYSNRKDTTPTRMFLHSLRLILPTCEEVLDVQSEDQFTPFLTNYLWHPITVVHKINESTFRLLD